MRIYGTIKRSIFAGEKYWFRFSHSGQQHRINLETEDEGEESAQTYVARPGGFFAHLIETNKVRQNPVDSVKMAELVPQARRKSCKYEERDRLISACDRADLKFVLYAGFHAGLRKGEIIEVGADWFDLDQDLMVRQLQCVAPDGLL